jgi:hypothetical protein
MSASVTDLPLPRTREVENEELRQTREAEHAGDEVDVTSVGSYRSVDDVRMLRSLSVAVLIQSLLLVVGVVVIAFLATRPVQQVVIERKAEGDRVVAINGKPVATGYAIGEDRPRAGDKKALAREWSSVRYNIDPLTREKDIARIYTFMEPNFAKGYAQLMTRQGEFEGEARERRQAVWTPQVVEVDRSDPYKVKVIGTWDLTKKYSAAGWAREMKQVIFTLHLVEDDRGRAPRNANTGFLIRDILDYKEIPLPTPASNSVATQNTQ